MSKSAAWERIVLAMSIPLVPWYDPLDLDVDTVASEMVGNISAGQFVALCRVTGDHDNLGGLGLDEKRHGMASPTARATLRLPSPAHHDAIEFQAIRLNVWNDEHGSSRFEQRGFDEKTPKHRLLGLRLGSNRRAGAPATGASSARASPEIPATCAASLNLAAAALAVFSCSMR
jgi:hypothetical protein